MIRLSFLFILHVLFIGNVAAQQTIDLWEKEVPFNLVEGENTYFKSLDKSTQDSMLLVKKVIKPKLHVFLANGDAEKKKAVLICPGGGYTVLALEKEGFAVARWLNQQGMHAFVLESRLPDSTLQQHKAQVPIIDALKAMDLIHSQKAEWSISTLGVMGFSAGGHLAAWLSNAEEEAEALNMPFRQADFTVLLYPVISMQGEFGHSWSRQQLIGEHPSVTLAKKMSLEERVNEKTPPTFTVVALDDGAVSPVNGLKYHQNIQQIGGVSNYYEYAEGGHGFGLGQHLKSDVSNWPKEFLSWMSLNFL
ncbi:alpha/beta hydrolase [Persicobacter diffluens]|uniref:Peptidase S9 prolyl oligopeptidase catalytic domain-containing protein n=1 Tax=Persicobacter diffluens TaxID=981 RepID=A0AAN5AN17_9BACT|nr:hypothetical protein PEDI_49140 [Persicobacter diffluens]